MAEDLAERLKVLIELIGKAGGFGSITLVIERGEIAHIVWSVDQRLIGPGPKPKQYPK